MTLPQLVLLSGTNLLLGLAAIPFYIRLAKAKNIVDTPNNRSSHTTATPRGGGIFLAFGTILFAGLSSLCLTDSYANWPFLATALCIAILGFIDDLKPLPSILRLGIQIALAAGLFALLSENLQSAIFKPPNLARRSEQRPKVSMFDISLQPEAGRKGPAPS